MSIDDHAAPVAPSQGRPRLTSDPAYQSFLLLRIGFAVLPIVFGAEHQHRTTGRP